MNNKLLITSLTVILCSFYVIWITSVDGWSKSDQPPTNRNHYEEREVPAVVNNRTPLKGKSDAEGTEDLFSTDRLASINDWKVQNGSRTVFSLDENGSPITQTSPYVSSYESYSTEMLQDLVFSDPHAALVLSGRLYESEEFDKAEPLLIRSAVNGYAQPMMDLALMYRRQARKAAHERLKNEATQLHIESLAWVHAMEKVYLKEPLELSDLGKMRNFMDDREVQEALNAAKVRGEQVYSSLQIKRNALGLPPLEGDMPPAMRELWEAARNGT